MFSKHSFLLMKRKRTARRTMKTPTADKKPMASGGTDKRTQRKNIITIKVAQIRVLTRDIIYSDSICLLMRVANTLQVLTLAGIPRTIHRGKEKDYHQVHFQDRFLRSHAFAHVVSSTQRTTLLVPILSLIFNHKHANYQTASHQMH